MRKTILGLGTMLLFVAGCGTIGNPFVAMKPDYGAVPADALKAFALEVEEAVAQGHRDFAPSTAGIVADDIVLQAVRTRAARTELVNEMLDLGYAWELNRGLIDSRYTRDFKENTNRRERDRYSILILNENNSRWAIYEGLVKANNFPPRALAAVQDAFFQARFTTLKAGQVYEGPDGAEAVK